MKKMWLLGVLLMVTVASMVMARQGVVRTKDGRKFEGDVTDKGAEGAAVVTRFGTLTVGRDDIASIDYTDNIPEQYKQRLAAMPKNAGAREHVELGQWLVENKQYELALTEADTALKLDPDSRDARLLKQVAEKQLLWSRAVRPSPEKTTTPEAIAPVAPVAPVTPVTPVAPATAADPLSKEQRRLLAADEIAAIRQVELRATDKVNIRFEKDVKKRFLQANPDSAAQFNTMPDVAKAVEILRNGAPDLSADVKVLGDPAPIAEFRRRIQPVLASGCASSSCHGGAKSGSFLLHTSGNADAVTYTNYFILTQYSTDVNGTVRKAIDRLKPADSLLIQYALPADKSLAPHPSVPGYTPLFRSEADTRQQQLTTWLNSLGAVEPKYAVQLQVHQGSGMALPATPAMPTTQPAEVVQPTPTPDMNPAPTPPANGGRGTDVNDALKEARQRLRPRGL